MTEARTMFARHKLGGSSDYVRWIRENHYIAIHWDNSPSTDEEEYGNDARSRGYQEIRRMRRVARNHDGPVVVGAYYGNRVDEFQNSMLIGRVEPEADVNIIHAKAGGSPEVYPSEEAAREAGVPDKLENEELELGDDEVVYKALPLVGCEAYEEPRAFSFKDYPLLSAVRPRHHSFCNWHAAKAHLRAIDGGRDSFREIESDVEDHSKLLAPAQLEVLCNEYLRLEDAFSEYTQTLPVGRTMRAVDIVGQFQSGNLFAQVTQDTGSDLKEKAEKLASYTGENSTCVLFGPSDETVTLDEYNIVSGLDPTNLQAKDILYIPVTDVVTFVDSQRPELLDTMYELPDPIVR